MAEPPLPTPQSVWIDIVPELQSRFGFSLVDSQHVRIWSLVLNSQYILHRVTSQTGLRSILVPSGDAPAAIDQISAFEAENSEWATDWVPPADVASPWASIVVLAFIGLFHGLNVAGLFVVRAVWMSEGSAQAGLIIGGEWFRTITALTLHADAQHVLSNMVIGGFFVVWLCRELGTGLGWFVILLSGTFGNIINALVQSPVHNSVGASTAVFGALGVLSALRMKDSPESSKDVLIPLMSGIILMALLGTGGERTDVGAHLFGLLAGLAVGLGLSFLIRRGLLPTWRVQQQLAAATMAIPLLAWALAFA
jgi:membrane associated rhomboid family serine protease